MSLFPPVLPPVLTPDWPAPGSVGAAISTRDGGSSLPPFDTMNLGLAVGDATAAVADNRARFAAALGGAQPCWLHLVHGSTVLRLTAGCHHQPLPPADAAWTSVRGLACTVTVADCLPALFTLRDGSAVAAAHAGWRGLAGGILAATVHALCAGTGALAGDVLVWLGPCIGPRQFEVGADVLHAFGQTPASVDPRHFIHRPRADGAPRWLANLQQLAHDQLVAAGVPLANVSASSLCTVEDGSRFFSFRRDGRTGRMAAAVWRR